MRRRRAIHSAPVLCFSAPVLCTRRHRVLAPRPETRRRVRGWLRRRTGAEPTRARACPCDAAAPSTRRRFCVSRRRSCALGATMCWRRDLKPGAESEVGSGDEREPNLRGRGRVHATPPRHPLGAGFVFLGAGLVHSAPPCVGAETSNPAPSQRLAPETNGSRTYAGAG